MKCRYEHDGACCNAGADQYMRKCKKPCEFLWPLSNADRIRAMSDEELARFLAEVENRRSAAGGGAIWMGADRAKDWLKQHYKEAT